MGPARMSRGEFLKVGGLLAAGLALPKFSMPAVLAAQPGYQLQTPHQVLQMDLSYADYVSRFNQLVSQGYRAIWNQGATNGTGEATFSAVWVRESPSAWFNFININNADYQAHFNTYSGMGYRPISVSGYRNYGVDQFAVIWVPNNGISYTAIHNGSSSSYQTFVDNAIASGYWPQVVDGYALGNAPNAVDRFISVWANIPAIAFETRHGLTSAQYQSFFSTYAPLGYHVTSISAYAINGTTYFAVTMVKDSVTDWSASHDWLPLDLFNHAVALEKQDYQPTVIEGYNTGTTRNFAAVWIKKSRSWTAMGMANANLASFDSAMQTFMQARNIPGGSLAVTKDGRLVYARGYRWQGYTVNAVKADSLFRIASLTKPLTSMAIMRLVQEGRLHLTDHLTTLLSLGIPKDLRMNNITVLQLLQHLGGWNRDTSGFDPMFADQVIAATMGVPLPISQQTITNYMTTQRNLDFTPGSMYNYSNYGYLLLGRIIEKVTGKTFAAYVQESVLNPLGITRIVQGASEFEYRRTDEVPCYVTDPGLYQNVRHAGAAANAMAPYGLFNLENMDSHGGYLASAVDLARFTIAFNPIDHFPILNQTSIDQTFAVPSIGANPNGSWYGCGWLVRNANGGLNTWHDGSLPGTSTLMVRRYDGLTWVVLFNQRDDPSGLDYSNIDGALHTAANAVSIWPLGDMFTSYGLPGPYNAKKKGGQITSQ